VGKITKENYLIIKKTMEIPFNLTLPDQALQKQLNKKLHIVMRPFIYVGIFVAVFILICLTVN